MALVGVTWDMHRGPTASHITVHSRFKRFHDDPFVCSHREETSSLLFKHSSRGVLQVGPKNSQAKKKKNSQATNLNR